MHMHMHAHIHTKTLKKFKNSLMHIAEDAGLNVLFLVL